MPKLNDATMLQNTLQTNHYGYSAVRPADLGASEYTLVGIAIDSSPSVAAFKAELENCLKSIVQACKFSPRADNLLLRIVQFNGCMEEIHGFKLLERCNVGDYDNALDIRGATALFDSAENVVSSTTDYAHNHLAPHRYQANAIIFVVTDGEDNSSKLSALSVRAALERAVAEEDLESVVSILVGVNVNNPKMSRYLNDFYTKAGFSQYIELGNASAKELAKLAAFVSRSISAQSQSLGTGGPSQLLTF